MGEADTISERVRFDDNVSFIDADADYITTENTNTKTEHITTDDVRVCEANSQTNTDDTTMKTHEYYSYDNAAGVSDEILPTVQRVIKVRML